MEPSQPDIVDQVRVNIAFEQMIVSVIAGALVGGALTLVIELGAALFGGGLSFSALLSALLQTLFVSFLIFLIGFFASVIIGAPLFMALEKAKRRNVWPYLAAALATALIVLVFAIGHVPAVSDFSFSILASTILPAIIIAVMFGRRMRPYWREVERAESEARDNIIRLH